MKSKRLIAVALLGSAAAIGIAIPSLAQRAPDSGPVARYDMRAGTTSGFGMGGGMGGMMSMMMGGGGKSQAQHELWLRLGSSRAAADAKPKADHFMPDGAKLGKSVALITPRNESGPVDKLPEFEEPSGRMLIFWGCGEHAPKGQPVIIDFSKLARGEVPPGVWTSSIPADWGPNLENSKTFGRWPAEDGKYVKADSSLLGAHRVAGNYSPEMSFTLSKDFMQPLSVKTAAQASGASLLSWGAVPDATGYFASLFGSKQGPGGKTGDIIMWSSSANRQFGGGLSDWLSPGQVSPLVKDKTVMTPQTTNCLVPAEVIAAASDFRMGTLTAFGPEENFSYPPRPADAKARWDLQWTARIRHRSTTSWMEAQGMNMGMMGMSDDEEDEAPRTTSQNKKECKPKKSGGLFGGLAGAVLGGGGGGNGC